MIKKKILENQGLAHSGWRGGQQEEQAELYEPGESAELLALILVLSLSCVPSYKTNPVQVFTAGFLGCGNGLQFLLRL